MLTALDLIGTAAFAASGASIGVYKRLDLFGVCVVGITTGIGGGIVRDLLLGVTPPVSMDRWQNITVALVFSLAVFVFHPAVDRIKGAVLVLDALGMGVFATTGASTALVLGANWWAAVIIGATTAIGGGVLRDVLVNEMPLVLRRDLYATPALVGAGLVVGAHAIGLPFPWGLVIGTVTATTLRLLALARGWNLPTAPHWPERAD
ncbi:trimeric intracellular cation channel family protein [Tomitella biformata]|uniref:trimeric intracellular cation channel family protein n=1 Tax=Tomitella biformata TaxID=630403 RepID=UPI0004649692|nr:trimeric intracellular cation channel family protein [Tomitella biformata]